jgi:hypothetical protein
VAPSTAEAAYARVSLRLESGELASALETPDGRVRAGRGAIPDALTLSRLQGDPFGFEKEVALVAAALSESVPAGLLADLAKIVEPGEPLVLSAQREVEALPWEWILVDGKHLALRNPVVRVSSALSDAARGYPVVGQPPTLLLIGDPSSPETARLPGALEEVERIASLSAGAAEAHLLTGDDATVANVIASLRRGDADVFHFAGHAWFDGSEHYLALADGQLRAAEFRSVCSARPPALVFLNSHYTAFVPPFAKVRERGRGQEEVSAAEQLRFMDVAMAAGCGAFVGCLGSPMDHTARDLALGLYDRLFRGEPVARAFHQSLVTLPTEPRSDALKYALSGSVDLVLATGPAPPVTQ